jgi:hypothetical protein
MRSSKAEFGLTSAHCFIRNPLRREFRLIIERKFMKLLLSALFGVLSFSQLTLADEKASYQGDALKMESIVNTWSCAPYQVKLIDHIVRKLAATDAEMVATFGGERLVVRLPGKAPFASGSVSRVTLNRKTHYVINTGVEDGNFYLVSNAVDKSDTLFIGNSISTAASYPCTFVSEEFGPTLPPTK